MAISTVATAINGTSSVTAARTRWSPAGRRGHARGPHVERV